MAMQNGGGSAVAVDLHAHTSASDGTLAPVELVRLAREAGLHAVAVTDHDTCAGHAEALAAGARLGVEVVPGVELSADEEGREVHILGYFVPAADAAWEAALCALRARRTERAQRIVEKLRACGVAIEWEDILREWGGEALGRPHIARALMRLGAARSLHDAFERYLGRSGSCFVPKIPFPAVEAIALIRAAGAVAVVAHPGLIGDDALLSRIADGGAQGVEVWHPDHDEAARARYDSFARARGLVRTGGSDFHGAAPGHRGDLGSQPVDPQALADLRAARSGAAPRAGS